MITWYDVGTSPPLPDMPPLPVYLDRNLTPREPWHYSPTEAALPKINYAISNRDAPVEVAQEKDGKWDVVKMFDGMAAFEAWHNPKYQRIRHSSSNAEKTVILIEMLRHDEPPLAKAEKVAKAPGKVKTGSKVALIADLLVRPQGCTTTDVLAATGWPSVSMPAQAKLAGLTLRKEKVGKVTTYWGNK